MPTIAFLQFQGATAVAMLWDNPVLQRELLVNLRRPRAFWLLRHLLEREQREQFDRFRCFTVDVEGRGTFAVLPQLAFSVVNVRSGDSYCVVSESPVPMRSPRPALSKASRVSSWCAGSQ